MARRSFTFDDNSTLVLVEPGAAVQGIRAWLEQGAWPTSFFVVSDSNIAERYAVLVVDALGGGGRPVTLHVVEGGEGSKSFAELSRVCDGLAEAGVDRHGMVVAIGGGVVSDLAGLAASLWKRGVRYAICPTTLEAAIDASLGGKTAINLSTGKNLVGSFYWPEVVAVDPTYLSTLPAREIRAAMAESIKHALIADTSWLAWQEDRVDAILALEPATIEEVIDRNMAIKAAIVARDPREQTGARMFLNFGHTVGHAIESAAKFSLRHGECVALGSLVALRLSETTHGLSASWRERTRSLFERLSLPVGLPEHIQQDVVVDHLAHDKKRKGDTFTFVLLRDAGDPVIDDSIVVDDVRRAIEACFA